jgi:hypothetical protein
MQEAGYFDGISSVRRPGTGTGRGVIDVYAEKEALRSLKRRFEEKGFEFAEEEEVVLDDPAVKVSCPCRLERD